MHRLSQTIAMLLFAVVAFTLSATAQLTGAAGGESAIRKVLQSQVDAWNRHDPEGFMAGYGDSPNLTFFSGATEPRVASNPGALSQEIPGTRCRDG
jgi:hypothetical protein